MILNFEKYIADTTYHAISLSALTVESKSCTDRKKINFLNNLYKEIISRIKNKFDELKHPPNLNGKFKKIFDKSTPIIKKLPDNILGGTILKILSNGVGSFINSLIEDINGVFANLVCLDALPDIESDIDKKFDIFVDLVKNTKLLLQFLDQEFYLKDVNEDLKLQFFPYLMLIPRKDKQEISQKLTELEKNLDSFYSLVIETKLKTLLATTDREVYDKAIKITKELETELNNHQEKITEVEKLTVELSKYIDMAEIEAAEKILEQLNGGNGSLSEIQKAYAETIQKSKTDLDAHIRKFQKLQIQLLEKDSKIQAYKSELAAFLDTKKTEIKDKQQKLFASMKQLEIKSEKILKVKKLKENALNELKNRTQEELLNGLKNQKSELLKSLFTLLKSLGVLKADEKIPDDINKTSFAHLKDFKEYEKIQLKEEVLEKKLSTIETHQNRLEALRVLQEKLKATGKDHDYIDWKDIGEIDSLAKLLNWSDEEKQYWLHAQEQESSKIWHPLTFLGSFVFRSYKSQLSEEIAQKIFQEKQIYKEDEFQNTKKILNETERALETFQKLKEVELKIITEINIKSILDAKKHVDCLKDEILQELKNKVNESFSSILNEFGISNIKDAKENTILENIHSIKSLKKLENVANKTEALVKVLNLVNELNKNPDSSSLKSLNDIMTDGNFKNDFPDIFAQIDKFRCRKDMLGTLNTFKTNEQKFSTLINNGKITAQNSFLIRDKKAVKMIHDIYNKARLCIQYLNEFIDNAATDKDNSWNYDKHPKKNKKKREVQLSKLDQMITRIQQKEFDIESMKNLTGKINKLSKALKQINDLNAGDNEKQIISIQSIDEIKKDIQQLESDFNKNVNITKISTKKIIKTLEELIITLEVLIEFLKQKLEILRIKNAELVAKSFWFFRNQIKSEPPPLNVGEIELAR